MSTSIDPDRFPLVLSLFKDSKWADEPRWSYYDFCMEEWLRFLRERGALEIYRADLQGDARVRDDTFAEIATAHFLEVHRSLPVIEWRPFGAAGKQGDLMVKLPTGHKMFVEVKRPSWQTEFAKRQGRDSPRLRQPKYLDDEEGSIVHLWQQFRDVVEKAYPKLPDSMPTLLVLCDDLTFPLYEDADYVEEALYRRRTEGFTDWMGNDGPFAGPQCQRLGAAATLNLNPRSNTVAYLTQFFPNPNACRSVQVPEGLFHRHETRDGAKWRLSANCPTIGSHRTQSRPKPIASRSGFFARFFGWGRLRSRLKFPS